MKIITVESTYRATTYYVSDDAKADAAYIKLKKALEEAKEFSNKDNAVAIELDQGEATFRIGSGLGGLSTVSIVPLNDAQAAVVDEINAWLDRFKHSNSGPR